MGDIVARKLSDLAVAIVRGLARWSNGVGASFLTDPAPFVSSPHLTPAQRCSIFNLAMSLVGVGLKMPTDEGGNKVWDSVVFERGMALAKGRTPVFNPWVHQSYAPVKNHDTVRGKGRRSFYSMLTGYARTGLIEGVEAAQFAGTDTAEVNAKLKAWYIVSVNSLTGTKATKTAKAKPGVLAQSRGFNLAVTADLKPRDAAGVAKSVTAESLAAEMAELEGEETAQ